MMINRLLSSHVLSVFKPFNLQIRLSIFLIILSNLSFLFAIWFLIDFISKGSLQSILVCGSLWLLSSTLESMSSWLAHSIEINYAQLLRSHVVSHLSRLSTQTLSKFDNSTLTAWISNDISKLHYMIAHLPTEIATFFVTPVISILFLTTVIGSKALLMLLPGLIASLYYLVVVPKASAKYGAERDATLKNMVTAVDDYVRGIKVNRIYGINSSSLESFQLATSSFTNGLVFWVKKVATKASITVALLQSLTTFVIAYVLFQDSSVEELATALFFGLAIVTPVLQLGHGLDYLREGKAAATRLNQLLGQEQLLTGTLHFPQGPLSFQLQNVVPGYENKASLKPINKLFKSGTISAITAQSGHGKSTLIRMMARLDQCQHGQILVNNININLIDEEEYRQSVFYLPQGIDVLPATIKENLKISSNDLSENELWAALDKVLLSKINLDQNAVILSGGERQRIGLARVFLSSAKIILLDEPTSALDSENAKILLHKLIGIAHEEGKIVIFITHDLELAQMADEVVYL